MSELAKENTEKEEVIELSVEGAEQFFELLDNPPPINEKLLAAARKYKWRGFYYE